MISLFILSIILTVVFRFFTQIINMEKKMKKAKENVLFKHNLWVRLNGLFSNLVVGKSVKVKDDKLYFYYDNKIDLNPKFSKTIFSILFLDENKNLILYSFPDEKDMKLKREEILARDIEKIRFIIIKKKSLIVPSKKNKIALKIKIKNKNKNFSFTFFVFSAPIIYFEEL